MARLTFTAATIAAAAALFGEVAAQGTAGQWAQCGGTGYTGPTTCVAGWSCVYSNPWYSQCLQGAASSAGPTSTSTSTTTSTTSKTSSASKSSSSSVSSVSSSSSKTSAAPPSTSSTPSGTGTYTSQTPYTTLLPGHLWLRAVEDPNFHKYVQSVVPFNSGDAILGPVVTAGQYQVTDGQLVQYLPNGGTLYGHVTPQTDATQNKLRLTFQSTPDTYGTFAFQGDGLIWSTPGINRPNTGAWLACSDPVDGTAALYVNLGNYAYQTPAGCADETLNYYNGATAVPKP